MLSGEGNGGRSSGTFTGGRANPRDQAAACARVGSTHRVFLDGRQHAEATRPADVCWIITVQSPCHVVLVDSPARPE